MYYIESSEFHRKIVDLFHEFFDHLEHNCNPCFLQYSRRSWSKTEAFEFDIQELTIDNDIDSIIDTYYKSRILLLRPYAGEKQLVIGCGNSPLANCGGYAFEDDTEKKSYRSEHHHADCYTINPEPSYNPSCVGFFSLSVFDHLPSYSFDRIEIEGIRIDRTDIFYEEITRLLSPNGIVTENDLPIMIKENDILVEV